MWNETTQQGSFTSDGTVKTLNIRSGYDWIEITNETALEQSTADLAYKFRWERGMTNGRGIVWTKLGNVASDPVTVGQIAANSGILSLDTSGNPLSAAVAISSATDLTEPVFSTGSTANVTSGTIVRLSGMTGQENLSGYDFAVDTIVTNTSFKMAAALATAPGAAASAGNYRIVAFDPIFYPRWRFITNITQAASAVFTLSVPGGYVVGQKVTVIVPTDEQAGVSDYGMTQIDGLKGIVTAVNDAIGTQTITVDIDSSGFTAFTFPTAAKAAIPLQKAIVVPAGYDTATAVAQSINILEYSYENKGVIGTRLLNPQSSGSAGPAGANGDVMYWSAGTSSKVTNE